MRKCKHSALGQRIQGFKQSIKIQIKLQENKEWEQNACGKERTSISGEPAKGRYRQRCPQAGGEFGALPKSPSALFSIICLFSLISMI